MANRLLLPGVTMANRLRLPGVTMANRHLLPGVTMANRHLLPGVTLAHSLQEMKTYLYKKEHSGAQGTTSIGSMRKYAAIKQMSIDIAFK